jgi:hypothetical protein
MYEVFKAQINHDVSCNGNCEVTNTAISHTFHFLLYTCTLVAENIPL